MSSDQGFDDFDEMAEWAVAHADELLAADRAAQCAALALKEQE